MKLKGSKEIGVLKRSMRTNTKKSHKAMGVLMLILILVMSLTACNAQEETKASIATLIIGTEGTYPPFSYHDDQGNLTGFDVEIATEVANRLGLKAGFLETKWDGLLAGLNTGRYEMVANQVWKNQDRDETFTLTDVYMKTNAVLVTYEGSEITSLDSVSGKRAGHSLTSAYAEISKSKGAEIVGIDTFTEAAENLKNRRIDYTVNDKETVAYYLAQNPDAKLMAFNMDLDMAEVVLVLPKTVDPQRLDKINDILAEMKSDGTIDALYQKYFTEIE